MQKVQKYITAQLGLTEKLQMRGLPDRWQHIMLGMMHASLQTGLFIGHQTKKILVNNALRHQGYEIKGTKKLYLANFLTSEIVVQ